MTVKPHLTDRTARAEPGTVWLSTVIVAALATGLTVLSAPLLSTVLVVLGVTIALAVVLRLLR